MLFSSSFINGPEKTLDVIINKERDKNFLENV